MKDLISSLIRYIRTVRKFIIIIIKYNSINKCVISIMQYLSQQKFCKVYIVDDKRKTMACSPSYFNFKQENIRDEMMPPLYYAIIKNQYLIGHSSAIYNDDYILYELYDSNNIDYTDNAFFTFRKHYDLEKEIRVFYTGRKNRKFDNAISLLSNYSSNYYHFVFEVLAKLWVINELIKIDNSIPILVDECIFSIPQFNSYLNYINGNREVIIVSKYERVKINNLYYISSVNVIPPNFINNNNILFTDVLFDFRSIQYIRDMMFKYYQEYDNNSFIRETNSGQNKIFLSRKNCKFRKYNESEIEDAAHKRNFVTIIPENTSTKQQISIFHNADVILSASGAALTNIIYCKPGTKVLVLISQKLDLSIFSSIANYLGLELSYLPSTNNALENLHDEFNIDISLLEEWFDYYKV